jgi:flagellar hook-associated protein 2
MTINGQIVAVSQPATLQQLADAINAKDGIGVTASVIQASANSFRLVLTANSSGTANAFTVTNSLTLNDGVDPSSVTFTDTDHDGTSGDDILDNAVRATDASVLVNNILVTSASNTLTSVIGGATITVLKKDAATTIGIDVAADTSALRTKLNTFVAAYNSLNAFTAAQKRRPAMAIRQHRPRSAAQQPRASLRSSLNTQYDAGGAFSYLSQAGIEFTQSGTLQVNNSPVRLRHRERRRGAGEAVRRLHRDSGCVRVDQHADDGVRRPAGCWHRARPSGPARCRV